MRRLGHEVIILAAALVGTASFLASGLGLSTAGPSAPSGLVLRNTGWTADRIGVVWFLVVIAIAWIARREAPPARQRMRFWLYALAVAGLAGTAWIMWAASGVSDLPPQYIVSFACVTLVFVAAASAPQAKLAQAVRFVRADIGLIVGQRRTWLLAAAAVSFVVLPPAFAARTERQLPPTVDEFVAWYAAQPRAAIPGDDPGEHGQAVFVGKFIDYQCPGCRSAEKYYAPLFEDLKVVHPGRVTIRTYDFPLDPACNRYVVVAAHVGACEAAVAVRLARAAGTDMGLIEWLWTNQDVLTNESVREAAIRLGIDPAAFEGDSYAAARADVQSDIDLAYKLGVRSTPRYYVNGVLLRFVPAKHLVAVIAHELAAIQNAAQVGRR